MTNVQQEADIQPLIAAVRNSAKYRTVSQDLIRYLIARELRAGRTEKETVKAVKSKLHQVAGAYFPGRARYRQWLLQLQRAAQTGDEAWREACCQVMGHHASTRERLPILNRFYAETLAEVGAVDSVLDVACGLNPLSIPWMPLAENARYIACDIYEDLATFLDAFLKLADLQGEGRVCDLINTAPPDAVMLALVLKTLPPLEQIDKAAGINLLRRLKAKYLLVSFPVQSLGGRKKGMAANYEARFQEVIGGEGWPVKQFKFETELAFLIEKHR